MPATTFPLPGTLPVTRSYVHHKQRHVAYLSTHYHLYTLKELEVLLGLPQHKIIYLCRAHGIKKRQPNRLPHPRKRTSQNHE